MSVYLSDVSLGGGRMSVYLSEVCIVVGCLDSSRMSVYLSDVSLLVGCSTGERQPMNVTIRIGIYIPPFYCCIYDNIWTCN